ncbi:hypothetical protein [Mucilaginibacter sp.]|uniref:hypothetical protein n=1 Tax=Mucilaginibacter sp. TaxID=1882438 RepID=UPI00326641D0
MADINNSLNDFQKIIEILSVIRSKINDQTDFLYTYWGCATDALTDIENCISKLEYENAQILPEINVLFAATGQFQELSMLNGWSDEYLKLAARFDICYHKLKSIKS